MKTNYTKEDLKTLEAAFATGAIEVTFADKKIRYKDTDEMLRTINYIKKQIEGESGGSRNHKIVFRCGL